MTLDEIRKAFPTIGIAVYAIEPGGAVTLEIYDGGEVFSFDGPTEAVCLAKAFPFTQEETKPADTPPAAAPPPPELAANVFE